jgi:hypothetical protein
MIGLRGRFGLILTTGDVLRITSIGALHQSSSGTVLLDVLLDHGGIPDGIDLAWQPKRYLGTPVPGATVATVNLAHVVGRLSLSLRKRSNSRVTPPCPQETMWRLVQLRSVRSPRP